MAEIQEVVGASTLIGGMGIERGMEMDAAKGLGELKMNLYGVATMTGQQKKRVKIFLGETGEVVGRIRIGIKPATEKLNQNG